MRGDRATLAAQFPERKRLPSSVACVHHAVDRRELPSADVVVTMGERKVANDLNAAWRRRDRVCLVVPTLTKALERLNHLSSTHDPVESA